MPRKPLPPQPAVILDAVTAFGSPVRVGILSSLRNYGESTVGELATMLDVERDTVRLNLIEIEKVGVVRSSPPPGVGRGRGIIVRYAIVPERVAYLGESLRRHVGG